MDYKNTTSEITITTQGSRTDFSSKNPTRKGKNHTLRGFSLCTRMFTNVIVVSSFGAFLERKTKKSTSLNQPLAGDTELRLGA